jgi:hypothetical protein
MGGQGRESLPAAARRESDAPPTAPTTLSGFSGDKDPFAGRDDPERRGPVPQACQCAPVT